MVTGGRDKPTRRTDPGVKENAPGGMLPAGAPGDAGRVPDGSGRVRRPADLLFAGIAHRDLRPENLFISEKEAGFRSLDAAVPAASELARRLDLAQALATLAQAVGPPGAIEALREGYGAVDERAVAAVLQPVALAPWGWRRCAPPRPA